MSYLVINLFINCICCSHNSGFFVCVPWSLVSMDPVLNYGDKIRLISARYEIVKKFPKCIELNKYLKHQICSVQEIFNSRIFPLRIHNEFSVHVIIANYQMKHRESMTSFFTWMFK